MTHPTPTDELLQLLRTRAYRDGTFLLTSGKESDFYIDVKQVSLHPKGLQLLVRRVWNVLRTSCEPHLLSGVAGVALGGCSLAAGVSLHSADYTYPLATLYVRKEAKNHGTKKLVESPLKLLEGVWPKIVLVEDVITTGGSSIAAIQALRAEGYEVPVMIAVIDREEGGMAAIQAEGVQVHALFKRSDFTPPYGARV